MYRRIFNLDSTWAKHLESSYFPGDVLRYPPQPGKQLWYLYNGSRQLVKSDHCNTQVVRWVVREKGITLAGPQPETLVDPISVDMLRQEIRDDISSWGAEIIQHQDRFNNRFSQSFIVLSYCRMLCDLLAGSMGSKRTDEEWAKAHLDPSWQDLIDRTWAARPYPDQTIYQPADKDDFKRTLEFVRNAFDFSRIELSP